MFKISLWAYTSFSGKRGKLLGTTIIVTYKTSLLDFYEGGKKCHNVILSNVQCTQFWNRFSRGYVKAKMSRASCLDKSPAVKWRYFFWNFLSVVGTQLLRKIIINLRDCSAPFWRKCLKQTYPEIIVGSQRRDSVVQAILQPACSTWVTMTNI